MTRSTSGHPSTNERGVLGKNCLFLWEAEKKEVTKK